MLKKDKIRLLDNKRLKKNILNQVVKIQFWKMLIVYYVWSSFMKLGLKKFEQNWRY